MRRLELQFFGGRGGSSGAGGGGAKGIAKGGAKGKIEISYQGKALGSETFTTFSGGKGAIAEFAVGYGNEINKGKYDVVYNMAFHPRANDVHFNSRAASWDYGKKNNTAPGSLTIGIKLNDPSGVSEKQVSYAKSRLAERVMGATDKMVTGIASQKTTMQSLSDQLKSMPAMTAREILDRVNRYTR